MDLNTISAVAHPTTRDQLPVWTAGDAWLAGGTWLFSEPQAHLTRLIDLTDLKWPALTVTETELSISATCTVAQLDALSCPAEWIASAADQPVLPRVPRLLQDLEDGDSRRQYLHVAAGGADDLARPRRSTASAPSGRPTAVNGKFPSPISSPATSATYSRRAICCGRSNSRLRPCGGVRRSARFR